MMATIQYFTLFFIKEKKNHLIRSLKSTLIKIGTVFISSLKCIIIHQILLTIQTDKNNAARQSLHNNY